MCAGPVDRRTAHDALILYGELATAGSVLLLFKFTGDNYSCLAAWLAPRDRRTELVARVDSMPEFFRGMQTIERKSSVRAREASITAAGVAGASNRPRSIAFRAAVRVSSPPTSSVTRVCGAEKFGSMRT
jgi:hypothetical protein